MKDPGELTLAERLRQKLMSLTPAARLNGHLEYWSENEPSEKVKGLLESAQAMHEASPVLAPPKLMLVLGMLDAERLRHAWMNDPDALRGEKTIQAASEGGKARAKWSGQSETMQAAVNAVHAERPSISYEEVKRIVSRRYGYPLSALKRYTKNPRRK